MTVGQRGGGGGCAFFETIKTNEGKYELYQLALVWQLLVVGRFIKAKAHCCNQFIGWVPALVLMVSKSGTSPPPTLFFVTSNLSRTGYRLWRSILKFSGPQANFFSMLIAYSKLGWVSHTGILLRGDKAPQDLKISYFKNENKNGGEERLWSEVNLRKSTRLFSVSKSPQTAFYPPLNQNSTWNLWPSMSISWSFSISSVHILKVVKYYIIYFDNICIEKP